MDRFVSTFVNKIDAKGRVSVPASFRTVLAKDGFAGVYCYPSLEDKALDAGGQRLVETIHGLLDELAPYSDERDHLAMALFGASEVLTLDQDGRLILPARLLEFTKPCRTPTAHALGIPALTLEADLIERIRMNPQAL